MNVIKEKATYSPLPYIPLATANSVDGIRPIFKCYQVVIEPAGCPCLPKWPDLVQPICFKAER